MMADEGDKTALAKSKQSVPETCAVWAFNDVNLCIKLHPVIFRQAT